MLISTKGRYALRVMIDLAEHQSEEFISLKEVAQRQEISEKYLESIIRLLVKDRVLESLRGKGGGYRLKKDPDQYTVGSTHGIDRQHTQRWHTVDNDKIILIRHHFQIFFQNLFPIIHRKQRHVHTREQFIGRNHVHAFFMM